jgi:hypothetical protein
VRAAWRSAVADASAVFHAGLDGAALVRPVAGQQAATLAQSCRAVAGYKIKSDRFKLCS